MSYVLAVTMYIKAYKKLSKKQFIECVACGVVNLVFIFYILEIINKSSYKPCTHTWCYYLRHTKVTD